MPDCSVSGHRPFYLSDQVRSLCKQALNFLLIQTDLGDKAARDEQRVSSRERWCNDDHAKLNLNWHFDQVKKEWMNEKLLARDLSFEYYQESAKLCSRADFSLSSAQDVWGYLHKLYYIHRLSEEYEEEREKEKASSPHEIRSDS